MKTYIRYPGFKAKAVTLSYDDGVEQDIRFMDIINKYGLKCTFNVNSGQFYNEEQNFEPGRVHRVMTWDKAIALYKDSGHEVAVHSVHHPFLEQLTPLQIVQEIFEDRKKLEQVFGTEVRGMAYPYGTYDDRVVEIAKNCGIVYSRTVKASYNTKLPTDWLRLSPTCHHTSSHLSELTQNFLDQKVKNHAILFYLWGHTYEFEQHDNWDVIEEFGKAVGNRDDIWYATNIEVYDYVEAYRALRFTADGNKVYNPTAIDVWFVTNKGAEYVIHPGETIEL